MTVRRPLRERVVQEVPRGRAGYLAWVKAGWSCSARPTAQGRRFSRVRVVGMPLTDYSRFGVWAHSSPTAAGEDIRYLTRDRAWCRTA